MTTRTSALPLAEKRKPGFAYHQPADGQQLHAGAKARLELAFNSALRKLNLVDRGDPICDLVARKVIKVGRSGVTNAIAIAENACRQLDSAATPSQPAAADAATPSTP